MKSIEVLFNEALAAVKKAGRMKKYEEASKTCTTIESKLNAAEAVLAEAGVVREAVRKNNGAASNYVEGNPFGPTVEEFRESSYNFSPGYIKEVTNPYAKADAMIFEGLRKAGRITEAEHTKLTGAKPEGYEKLTEQKKADFDFARAIGLSESEAFNLVNIAGSTFKEVSRR